MATYRARSTDGNNADDGSTWPLAKLDLAGVDAVDVAGDLVYVSKNHAETTAGSLVLNFAGTAASRTRLICADDAADPPTATATTGTVSTTALGAISVIGFVDVYGLTLNSADSVKLGNSTAAQDYADCKFICNSAGSGAFIDIRGATRILWENADIKFGNEGQRITLSGALHWRGGSVLAGSTSPTTLFAMSGATGTVASALVEGVDFSNCAAAMNLATVNAASDCSLVLRFCKLPPSWTGNLLAGTILPAHRASLYNCDAGDTNYKLWLARHNGSVKDETTFVKTSGASDGTTSISHKFVTNANATLEQPLRGDELTFWNETVGSAITVTVDILHDSLTPLKDDQAWIEAMYLGTSGAPLGNFVRDRKANLLASGADQPSSAASWTTTGMQNPNKQKLELSFTPQEKGPVLVRVCIAKPSYTVYGDPKLVIS